jgi:hypothetical protein
MLTKRTPVISRVLWLPGVLIVSALLAGCTLPSPGPDQLTPAPVVTSSPASDIGAVLDEHQEELMRLPGVVGVGIGQDETTGEPIIVVLLAEPAPDLEKTLPQKLDGYSVKPLVVGEIKAQ